MNGFLRKTISTLLILSLSFSLGLPAFAASQDSIASGVAVRAKTIESEIDKLLKSYKGATTQEDQEELFYQIAAEYESLAQLEMTTGYESDIAPMSAAWIRIDNITVDSSNKVTFSYTTLQSIPNGATVSIGFEYPARTRMLGQSFLATSTPGSYSKTITAAPISFGAQYYTKLVARNYTDKEEYGRFWDELDDGVHRYKFHLVTSADVVSSKVTFYLAGGVVTATLSVAGWTVGASLFGGLTTILDLFDDTPLAKDQYMVLDAYVDTSEELVLHFSRYSSRASYLAGDDPLEEYNMYHPLQF